MVPWQGPRRHEGRLVRLWRLWVLPLLLIGALVGVGVWLVSLVLAAQTLTLSLP